MATSYQTLTKTISVEEMSPSSASSLASLIESYYLTPNSHSFEGFSYQKGRGEDGSGFNFWWKVLPGFVGLAQGRVSTQFLLVHLSIGHGGVVAEFSGLDPSDPLNVKLCEKVADDISAVVSSYMTNVKSTSLYFVASTKKKLPGEGGEGASSGLLRNFLRTIFAGNTVNLYLFIMALSFLFILFLGDYALVAMLGLQLLALAFADRLVLATGGIRPDGSNPEVVVVSVKLTRETIRPLFVRGRAAFAQLGQKLSRDVKLMEEQGAASKDRIRSILWEHGVEANLDDIDLKTRNPFEVVKSVAGRFGLTPPKIAIVNTPIDNAAATGVTPGHSAITITAGALEDLNDDELEAVVGHEMGHVKGHDSLILFVVTCVMYLGGIYLWLPVLLFLGFFYFIIAFAVIFIIGKFLETRADTESAAVLGTPKVLAEALKKISFRQLYGEKYSSTVRLADWLRFDPHPPSYFRVQRLLAMANTGKLPTHTFIVSVRDCVVGFFSSVRDSL